MARYIAKNITAAELADRCSVQLAYVIGEPQPVSVMISTDGTGAVPDHRLEELVRKHFDLSPRAIIESLNLLRPIYRQTAAYGHFGREHPDFTWERTDRADDLKKG